MDGEECLRTLEELQASDGVREEETMDLFCFSLQGDCETFCPEITDARQMTVLFLLSVLKKGQAQVFMFKFLSMLTKIVLLMFKLKLAQISV